MANAIGAGIASLVDALTSGQTWEDRLREGAYTSPSGTRIVYAFEDVERTTPLKGKKFTFPGVDEAYVQRTGFDSREYPMRVIFWGANHDKVANAFERAVLEPGMGRLEHPMYGRIPAVPFGDLTRRDDLKTAANQVILEVTFLTSVGQVYPSSRPSGSNEILGAVAGFDLAAAGQFDDLTDLKSAVNKATGLATIKSMLREVSSKLDSISDTVAGVNRDFRDLQATVNGSLDILIGQPLLLARQIGDLIKAPARALAGIESRLDAYARLAASIFGMSAARPGDALAIGKSLSQRRSVVANDLHISDLFAMQSMAGSMVAVTAADSFATRTDALRAVSSLQSQYDNLVAWRDDGFAAINTIPEASVSLLDPGSAIQALQAALAVSVGFLVQTSFGLKPERRIVLDRARTIVDLAAELYGSVDDSKLDLLITSNDLTGDQILELQRGQTISYYPD